MNSITTGSILGNYEIIRELGRGGMGVVYKAHEQSLQRVVALKVLPRNLAETDEFVKRFLREARAAAQLNHPNIVITHAVGEADGHYFIAMEYVKGATLNDMIRDQGQMNVINALKIIGQVSQALLEAHRHKIIHRDIKPQNIMIDLMGRARVMDFGLAHIDQDSTKLTQTGALLGTPVYMSPEQCRGEPLGPESDIFSLGVTLYEMLAGRRPFDGDSPLSIMHQIVNEPIKPITDYNSRVPNSVMALLNKMMNRHRNARYQDTLALATDIKRILKNDASLKSSDETGDTLIVHTQDAPNQMPDVNADTGENLLADIGIDPPPRQPAAPDLKQKKEGSAKRWAILAAIIIIIFAGAFGLMNRSPSDEGWIDLLQDESMSAWDNPYAAGDLGEWHIEDGVLSNRKNFAGRVDAQTLDIATKEDYQDFELGLDYRVEPGANSGVYLRGRTEIQIIEWVKNDPLQPVQMNGAIYDLHPPLADPANASGEWNTMYIRYKDSKVTATLNGTTIHDEQLVRNVSDASLPGNVSDKGPVLLQNHTGKVWFRSIRIRPINVDKDTPNSAQQTSIDKPSDKQPIDTQALPKTDADKTAASAQKERILNFPLDRRVGGLWAINLKRAFPEARGTVVIPADVTIGLGVDEQAVEDLKFLKALAPDDLDALWFDPTFPLTRWFPQFAHLTGLKTLQVKTANLQDPQMEYIKNMRDLETFSASGARLTEKGVRYLAEMTKLNTISLDLFPTVDEFASLELNANLPKVDRITDASVMHFTKLPHLEHLSLAGANLSNEGVKLISTIKTLNMTNLSFNHDITDAGLAHLADMPNMTWIAIRGLKKITDAGLLHVARMPALEILDITGCNVTPAGILNLTSSPTLHTLDLAGFQFTPSAIKALRQLPHLTTLRFRWSDPPSPESIAAISTIPNIVALEFRMSRLQAEHIVALKTLTQLQELNLRDAGVPNTATEEFKKALPNLRLQIR